MKHTLKTTLALLFAGVINLSAQTHEAAINGLKSQQGFSPSSEASITLKNTIMAEAAVSDKEALFVVTVLRHTGASREDILAAWEDLAAKGSVLAHAAHKAHSDDFTGWTPEMMSIGKASAAQLANNPNAPDEFKSAVFAAIRQHGFAHPQWVKFFKSYRAAMPKAQQLAVTAAEKDALIARPNRDDAANAFLASLSADLVALQLDQ